MCVCEREREREREIEIIEIIFYDFVLGSRHTESTGRIHEDYGMSAIRDKHKTVVNGSLNFDI